MQCLSPFLVSRSDGKGTVIRTPVPCGKCYACLSRKRNQWAFRLQKEQRYSEYSHFVTLTYDDGHLEYNDEGYPVVSKRDVQLFLKRLRKTYKGAKIRYFVTSEYGPTTFRPHYHGIFFGIPGTVEDVTRGISQAWQHGFVSVGSVTEASINYCAKYCITKNSVPKGRAPCFSLMSRRPGLGSAALDKMREHHKGSLRFYCTLPGGFKVSMPRYYKEKIFSKQEIASYNYKVQADILENEILLEQELNKQGRSLPVVQHEQKADYVRRMEKLLDKTKAKI